MSAKKGVRKARVKQSIWTPANVVTLVRVAFMPVWLLVAEFARTNEMLNAGTSIAWASFILYTLIALTAANEEAQRFYKSVCCNRQGI